MGTYTKGKDKLIDALSRCRASKAEKDILVVEDDDDIGYMVTSVLSSETPCNPHLVNDGYEALETVHEVRPALFVLDYQLPGMDGLRLYDQLHSIAGLENVPAIIMSANPPWKELARRGIIGILKPFSIDELIQGIRRLVG